MTKIKGRQHLRGGKLVLVEWNDAWSWNEAWTEMDEIPDAAAQCVTIGLFIKKTADQVILATAWGLDEQTGVIQYKTIWGLPIGMITEVHELEIA
jgi:hypothetical protein